ncbi:MAG: hypothetical protein SOZ34_02565 [Clostridia bacterium]|nr:hypothetical protein [Clostridia bacterium]
MLKGKRAVVLYWEIKFDYSFAGITERTFLTDDGNVMIRDVNSKEDTFYATGASDVVFAEGNIYVIEPENCGRSTIE